MNEEAGFVRMQVEEKKRVGTVLLPGNSSGLSETLLSSGQFNQDPKLKNIKAKLGERTRREPAASYRSLARVLTR